LPPTIADRLKKGEESIADGFDNVSVLFADLASFTPLAQELDPKELVELLNNVFTRFDHISKSHGIEKIKTIGDAYMAVAGAPEHKADHAYIIAEAALEMLDVMTEFSSPTGHPIEIRIGMSTGPAIAGVIGAHKFAYDIWGDTINTASRMESHGEIGKAQVCDAVYKLLEKDFLFENRGNIHVKGKGDMETYWLVGKK